LLLSWELGNLWQAFWAPHSQQAIVLQCVVLYSADISPNNISELSNQNYLLPIGQNYVDLFSFVLRHELGIHFRQRSMGIGCILRQTTLNQVHDSTGG